MHKKLIMLGILLCIFSSIAFAEQKRLTREDYQKQLQEYINETNIKIDKIYKIYNDKIATNKDAVKKLVDEEEQIGQQLRKCYITQENADMNDLLKGACGHLYGKTTYLKTSSGLVIADDTYALNKCLAKQPTSAKKSNSCKILNDKHKKIKSDIEFYNNQFSAYKNERDAELNKIKLDAKNKANELTNACKQANPLKQTFGYCNGLEVNFTTD